MTQKFKKIFLCMFPEKRKNSKPVCGNFLYLKQLSEGLEDMLSLDTVPFKKNSVHCPHPVISDPMRDRDSRRPIVLGQDKRPTVALNKGPQCGLYYTSELHFLR